MCFQALVATDTPGLGYMDLLRMLTGPVYSQSAALPHKQAYCSIAKCVAALTRACPTEGPAVVGQFIQVTYLSTCTCHCKSGPEGNVFNIFGGVASVSGCEEQPLNRLHQIARSTFIGRGGAPCGPQQPTWAQDCHPGRLLILQWRGNRSCTRSTGLVVSNNKCNTLIYWSVISVRISISSIMSTVWEWSGKTSIYVSKCAMN